MPIPELKNYGDTAKRVYDLMKPVVEDTEISADVSESKIAMITTPRKHWGHIGEYTLHGISSNFKGFGSRIRPNKNTFNVHGLIQSDAGGTIYCDITDDELNTIATSEAVIDPLCNCFTFFKFEDIDLLEHDTVWIRFYGDGQAVPRRSSYVDSDVIVSEGANGLALTIDDIWFATESEGYKIPFYLSYPSDVVVDGSNILDQSIPRSAMDQTFDQALPTVVYCGRTRKYTKLIEAIAAATETMSSIVYVDPEEFDLVEEYGPDYFLNYAGTADGVGIILKNNVTIVFASGAKVLFDYPPDGNPLVHELFSPFNAGIHGFTLINAWVESTNCRYSVHDERASADDSYKNIYQRCTFIHDSTATAWGAHQAIGGGLGKWGDILIEDCYGYAKDSDVFTYHNAGYMSPTMTKFKSNLVFRGCYIAAGGGTIRVNATGYSTLVSRVLVTNCSLTSAPTSGKTTPDATDNVEMFSWNNVIR